MENLGGQRRRALRIVQKLKKLFPHAKMTLKYSNNLELLVAVILSAQCTDKKVNEVTAKLFKKYRTLDDYINANSQEFEKDIFSTGFYKAKTKHILVVANMIKKRFSGRVPKTMKEILTLPGVARKTANIVLGNAYGIVEGVAVDTHVRRLAKAFGLTRHNNPNKIEYDLMKLLPKKEWFLFTYRLIEYGRTYCGAKHHDHTNCPLKKYMIICN